MDQNIKLFLKLLNDVNSEYKKEELIKLLKNLLEILGTIVLLDWAVNEAPDVIDGLFYNNADAFHNKFPFWEEMGEVQKAYNTLLEKNYNYYFILIMIIYEKFLNDLIDFLNNKLQFSNVKIFNDTKYSYNDNGIFKKDRSCKKNRYIREADITTKLWFFHEIFGCKRPKTSEQIKELDETDFKFFSELRNFLLHNNAEIKDSDYLGVYKKIEPCIITPDNKILLNSTFFYRSVHDLFNICQRINNLVLKKIFSNHPNKLL